MRPVASAAREQLADALRELIDALVTLPAPPADLNEAASAVDAVTEKLRRSAEDEGAGLSEGFGERRGSPGVSNAMAGFMPLDMIIGRCNPLAPPLVIEFAPPLALARVVFTDRYAGAPGCVHGAAIAGAFDVVLSAANVLADAAGPTRNLTVRYRRPTLLHVDSVFEAEVIETDGTRTTSVGRLLQGGVLVAEAVGEFAVMDRDRIAAMHRRPGGTSVTG